MARPTKKEVALLDTIESLQGRLRKIQEAISPGRIANDDYYIGVAKRFREHASKTQNDITLDWTPTRPPIRNCGKSDAEE